MMMNRRPSHTNQQTLIFNWSRSQSTSHHIYYIQVTGQLSLASLRGSLIEYQLCRECHLCRVAGNTGDPYGM